MTVGEHVDDCLKWSGYKGSEAKTKALQDIKRELNKEIVELCATIEEKMRIWKQIDNRLYQSELKKEGINLKWSKYRYKSIKKNHKSKL